MTTPYTPQDRMRFGSITAGLVVLYLIGIGVITVGAVAARGSEKVASATASTTA